MTRLLRMKYRGNLPEYTVPADFPKVIKPHGRSLSSSRYQHLADARLANGSQTPTTFKKQGKHRAVSGLISRRGYIRIIREDIGVVQRDVMISELKTLAKQLLTGRNAILFERRVIAPLDDPHTPRPSVEDLAIEFNISPQRVYKIISKCWKKIEKAHRAAQAKEEAPIMLTTFATKRQTGGLTYQSDGRYWDASDWPSASNYSTSINSAASAASTKDLKNENE